MSRKTTPQYQEIMILASQDQPDRADQSVIGPVLAIVRYPTDAERPSVEDRV